MQQWNIAEIREGVYGMMKEFPKLDISINQLSFETTDTHILDLIGESKDKDKVKGGVWACIKAKKDNTFAVGMLKLLYGGGIVEREVFVDDKYMDDEYLRNIAYARAVRQLEKKSHAYNHRKEFQNTSSFNTQSYVIVEMRADGVPVVKWVTFEYVYYADTYQYAEKTAADICEIPFDLEENNYNSFDLYKLYGHPARYGSPIHFTKARMDADISYKSNDGEKSTYHLQKIYETYDTLLEALHDLEKNLGKTKLKKKWQKLAGMDIEKMDELASYLAMEAYFRSGYKGIRGKSVSPLERKSSETMIQYLDRQVSYEDYIALLSGMLIGLEDGVVREAFLYLKENSGEKPLDIAHKFVKPHLKDGYEVGKVYLADVVKESLGSEGGEKDALVKLYDEATHYKFMGRILYNDHVFMHAEYHGYSNRILAEYFDYYGWIGNAETEAYLKDNVYVSGEGCGLHGREGQTLPVRIVGYRESLPIVEYAKEWHY